MIVDPFSHLVLVLARDIRTGQRRDLTLFEIRMQAVVEASDPTQSRTLMKDQEST